MLFIVVPKDMEFVKKEKDVLVDKNGVNPDIMLQDIVKDYLQHVSADKVEIAGLTIYNRKPPDTNDLFLKYKQERSGAAPSKFAVEMINGKDWHSRANPAQNTKYGERWQGHSFLSPARQKKVEKKDAEVRGKRRHTSFNSFNDT